MNDISIGSAESTIAQVSAEYGVTLRALRFYEGKNLITPWRDGLRRIYDAEELDRLRIILASKRLGFTLAEIREILDLGGIDKLPPERLAAQIEHLERQRCEVEAAIAEMKGMQADAAAAAGVVEFERRHAREMAP